MTGRLEIQLQHFALVATAWFEGATFIRNYWEFFRDFVDADKLANADWPYFQRLGTHIHAFTQLAIARANALGKPNHPIETYRNVFMDLAHGQDPVEMRVRRFADREKKLRYFGDSAISEVVGQVLADQFMLFNARDEWAVEYLGIAVDAQRGDRFADRYLKFNKAVQPVVDAYEKVVGRHTDLPVRLEVDQFFSWLYGQREALNKLPSQGQVGPVIPTPGLAWPANEPGHVWLIAAGENSAYWGEWQKDGVIAVGFGDIDLSKYADREAAFVGLQEAYGADPSPVHDSLCAYEFVHVMQPGDVVFVRKGRSAIIGYGIITTGFAYDPSRATYKNARGTKWLASGNWRVSDKPFVTKTLLQIGGRPDFVADIL